MTLFPDKTPRQTAVDLIRQALEDHLGQSSTLTQLAENLDAIANVYGERTENLLWWIDEQALGKQWTGAEFRRWCQLRRQMRQGAESRLPSNHPE